MLYVVGLRFGSTWGQSAPPSGPRRCKLLAFSTPAVVQAPAAAAAVPQSLRPPPPTVAPLPRQRPRHDAQHWRSNWRLLCAQKNRAQNPTAGAAPPVHSPPRCEVAGKRAAPAAAVHPAFRLDTRQGDRWVEGVEPPFACGEVQVTAIPQPPTRGTGYAWGRPPTAHSRGRSPIRPHLPPQLGADLQLGAPYPKPQGCSDDSVHAAASEQGNQPSEHPRD